MKHSTLAAAALASLATLAITGLGDAAPQDAGPKHLNLAGRTDSRPFCHAVLAGETLYVAGTLGVDPATGAVPDDVKEEITIMLDLVKAKLALGGMTMDDLVQIQVFCPDLSLYGTFNEIYATYFEKNFPARAFIGSGPLLRDAHFEINGIAVKG